LKWKQSKVLKYKQKLLWEGRLRDQKQEEIKRLKKKFQKKKYKNFLKKMLAETKKFFKIKATRINFRKFKKLKKKTIFRNRLRSFYLFLAKKNNKKRIIFKRRNTTPKIKFRDKYHARAIKRKANKKAYEFRVRRRNRLFKKFKKKNLRLYRKVHLYLA